MNEITYLTCVTLAVIVLVYFNSLLWLRRLSRGENE